MKTNAAALSRRMHRQLAERQRRAKIHRACLEISEETLGDSFGCTPDIIARACVYVLCDKSLDANDPLDEPFNEPLTNGYDDHASYIAAVCDDYLARYESRKCNASEGPNLVKARRLVSLCADFVG